MKIKCSTTTKDVRPGDAYLVWSAPTGAKICFLDSRGDDVYVIENAVGEGRTPIANDVAHVSMTSSGDAKMRLESTWP